MQLPGERIAKLPPPSTSLWRQVCVSPNPLAVGFCMPGQFTPSFLVSSVDSADLAKSANETRKQRVDRASMHDATPSRLFPASCGGQSDVECGSRLAILAPCNRVDASLVSGPGAPRSFGDVQANTGGSAERLIAQAAIGDGSFPDGLEQLASLLVREQLFKGKISKVRHRRLLSKAERGG